MTTRTRIAAGNWKMNGVAADLAEVEAIAATGARTSEVVTLLCLPATLIDRARGYGVSLGGQTLHAAKSGAHTGDISGQMLVDAGATYVIVGHSERRTDHGESDADICAQAGAAWAAGLTAVICIGETEAQYRAGETLDVLRGQIAGSVPQGATPGNTVIAYEPVWAIGTGLTPEVPEIQSVHAEVRAALGTHVGGGENLSVLYGGSVKAANASEIFALEDVDGGLVGGASLKAADFVPVIEALAAS
ncbi:triose-phosphate isomerase [Roseobacter sp.]|uniref:triose-phosphate isomerase n=1 Tax=Roseobacter sp. TaxID=1907202 RepID=UPI0025FA0BB4|nr:triose-phosphate isomerase [Roseobacter sp.]